MGQEPEDKGQLSETKVLQTKNREALNGDFVLEKGIFANIFEKDIRRVFIYKKSERLAKAIHLIGPAFAESVSLRNRMDSIAIGLVDAAILPPGAARARLSRELLALSSVLSIARTGGLLSPMNAELIAHEAHVLLHEIASYEEPRLFLDEAPTLSGIARTVQHQHPTQRTAVKKHTVKAIAPKGQTRAVKDSKIKDRREGVLSLIKNKGTVSIKDISTMIRGVSEKTIQRELSGLMEEGLVVRHGERRWSVYSLA